MCQKRDMDKQRFQGKVLAVDDKEANRYLIRIVLERLGLEVRTAEDGVQAVDKAIGEHFDLIIMDIMMPNMDGYEATRRLRAKQVNVPIIAWTSDISGDSRERCLRAGCSEYMVKPLDFLLLREMIGRYLPVSGSPLPAEADDRIEVGRGNSAESPGQLSDELTVGTIKPDSDR